MLWRYKTVGRGELQEIALLVFGEKENTVEAWFPWQICSQKQRSKAEEGKLPFESAAVNKREKRVMCIVICMFFLQLINKRSCYWGVKSIQRVFVCCICISSCPGIYMFCFCCSSCLIYGLVDENMGIWFWCTYVFISYSSPASKFV